MRAVILSVSRRTDIPCYYGEWFVNRLKAGYVLTRNPFNHAQLSRLPLSPETVDCIVFWTKDAENILPHLETVDKLGYKYYFQFTLTPYGRAIEQNLRDKSEIEETFIRLSKRIGRERVLWRYDPIVLNGTLTAEWHREQFERLCGTLSAYTESVTVSFVDLYAKLKTPLIREISAEEIAGLSAFIGKTAAAYGLKPRACCEKADLTPYGIERAGCIDRAVIEKICGYPLALNRDANQREGCGCAESVDIGAYNTCLNGCVYCYANDGAAVAQRRYAAHDPQSGLLTGGTREGKEIKERKVESNRM